MTARTPMGFASLSLPMGAVRPLAVVAGALLTLQSSQGLELSKIAFFAIVALALAGSSFHVWRSRDTELVRIARPWLVASGVLATILVISVPVALAHGTSPTGWARDAASYALVAAAPWLALDLGLSVSPRTASRALIVAGSLSTVSFTLIWTQRRHLAELPIDRLVLPSFAFAAALFAFAVAHACWSERHRWPWAIGASVVIGLLLVTGTRTTLVLAVVPVVIWLDIVIRRRAFAPSVALSALLPLLVVAAFAWPATVRLIGVDQGAAAPAAAASPSPSVGPGEATGGVAGSPGPSPTPAPSDDGRYEKIADVAAGTDPSLQLRWRQTEVAWILFTSAPLVGNGPGVSIPWVNWDGSLVMESWADTPLTILAKFGLLGILIWIVLGWATVTTLRHLRSRGVDGLTVRSAILGFAAGIVALTPLGPQLEDKGTGLAILLLLGIAFATLREVPAEPAQAERHG